MSVRSRRKPEQIQQATTYFCPICEKDKPNDQFYTRKRKPDGVALPTGYCKPCTIVDQKRRRDEKRSTGRERD